MEGMIPTLSLNDILGSKHYTGAAQSNFFPNLLANSFKTFPFIVIHTNLTKAL